MNKTVLLIIGAFILLLIIFIAVPFVTGALINQGSPTSFLSMIVGIFSISGAWQLFKGKIKSGVALLSLAVGLFMLSQHLVLMH